VLSGCLYWIAKALEKDPEYSKGLVLREKMLQECPHLRRDSQNLFRFWFVLLLFSCVTFSCNNYNPLLDKSIVSLSVNV